MDSSTLTIILFTAATIVTAFGFFLKNAYNDTRKDIEVLIIGTRHQSEELGKLKGKIDAYIKHKDSYSIIDFKVTNISEAKIDTYGTQLLSYALMFEYPEKDNLHLTPINKLGIFCFEPEIMQDVNNSPNFKMATKYYDIKRDDNKMIKVITDIIDLLEGPIPASDIKCSICSSSSVLLAKFINLFKSTLLKPSP